MTLHFTLGNYDFSPNAMEESTYTNIADEELSEFYLNQLFQSDSGNETTTKHSDREPEDRVGEIGEEVENCSKEHCKPKGSAIKAAVVNKLNDVKSGLSLYYSEIEGTIPRVLRKIVPDRTKSTLNEHPAEADTPETTSPHPETESNILPTCSNMEQKEEIIKIHSDAGLQPGPNEKAYVKLRMLPRSRSFATSTRLIKGVFDRSDSKKMNNYGVESDTESVNQSAETAKASPSLLKKIISEGLNKVKRNSTFTSNSQKNKTQSDKESTTNTEKYCDEVLADEVLTKEKPGRGELNEETVLNITSVHMTELEPKVEANGLNEQKNHDLAIEIDGETYETPKEGTSTSRMNNLINIMSNVKINLSALFNKPKNTPFEASESPREDTYELEDENDSLNTSNFPAENVRKTKEPVSKKRRFITLRRNRRLVSRASNPFRKWGRVKNNMSVSSPSRDLPTLRPKYPPIWTSARRESSQPKKEASSSPMSENTELKYNDYEYDELPIVQENPPSKLNETDDGTYDYFNPDYSTHTGIKNHDPKPRKRFTPHNFQIKLDMHEEDLYQNEGAITLNEEMISPPIPPKCMKKKPEIEKSFELPRRSLSRGMGKVKGNMLISKNRLLTSLKIESKRSRPLGNKEMQRKEFSHDFDNFEEYEQCLQPTEKRKEESTNLQLTGLQEDVGDEYELYEDLSPKVVNEYDYSKLVFPDTAMLKREMPGRDLPSLPKKDIASKSEYPLRSSTIEHCQDARHSITSTSKIVGGQESKTDAGEEGIERGSQCQNKQETRVPTVDKTNNPKKENLAKETPPEIPARPRNIPQYILSRQLSLMSADLDIQKQSENSIPEDEGPPNEPETCSVPEDKRSSKNLETNQKATSEAPISGSDNFSGACENDIYTYLDSCYS
ncbi:hypothetical protein Aperf_G00000124281 [Anoplocephala perfoliata]